MLGEVISEGKGKRTARRVLATEPLFAVEVSFEESTKVLGIEGFDVGTYTSTNKPDGSLYGEGQGVIATVEGEIVTWKGIGAGKLLPNGNVSYRGALSFSTTSKKLASLNSIAGAFEFDVDAEGNTHSKIWQWS